MLVAVLGARVGPLSASESRRSQQWALDTLDLDELHGSLSGNGVVVAVLDTAIASGHQDLVGVLTKGFDFIEDRSFDPVAPDRQFAATDHGTMVASIIGAPADDVGITGVAPGVSIMPVRIIPDVGQGSAGDMAAGIRWALDHGADIINVSVRTSFDSTAVRDSVELAAEMGVPIVASAGLGPTPTLFYPAAYESVIAVAALMPSLEQYHGSPTRSYVDLAAPGFDVVAAGGARATAYRMGRGTSFAAPHVSGVLALLKSATKATAVELRSALESSAIDLGDPGRDDVFGAGLIDAVGSFAILDMRPEPPALVTGTRFGNRLFLTWTLASSDDVAGYQVLFDDVVVLSIEGGPSTALVPLLKPGTSSVVTVRTIDQTGQRSYPTPIVAPPSARRAAIVGPAEAGSSDFFICTDCFPIEVARWRVR